MACQGDNAPDNELDSTGSTLGEEAQLESPPRVTPPLPAPRRRQVSPALSLPARLQDEAGPRVERVPLSRAEALPPSSRYLLLDEYVAPEVQERLPRPEAHPHSATSRRPGRSGSCHQVDSAPQQQQQPLHRPRRESRLPYHPSSPRYPWDARRDQSAPPRDAARPLHPVNLLDRYAPEYDEAHYQERYPSEHRRSAPVSFQDLPYRGRDVPHTVQTAGRSNIYVSDGLTDQAPVCPPEPVSFFPSQHNWLRRDSAPVPPALDDGEFLPPPGTEHLKPCTRSSAINGEFINLSELLNSANNSEPEEFKTVIDEYGRVTLKPIRKPKIISTSYKWLEAWSTYELLICSSHGLKLFQEMVAYRLFIIGLFHKYKLPCILSYDFRHRQILGLHRSLNFSTVNYNLYIMLFDSAAVRAGPRCTRCNSGEHGASDCPFRPAGQASDLPRARGGADRAGDRAGDRGARSSGAQSDRSDKSGKSSDVVCYQFNDNKCKNGTKCPRKHECLSCGGPDPVKSCKCKK